MPLPTTQGAASIPNQLSSFLPEVGSSRNNTEGAPRMPAAIDSRLLSPPDRPRRCRPPGSVPPTCIAAKHSSTRRQQPPTYIAPSASQASCCRCLTSVTAALCQTDCQVTQATHILCVHTRGSHQCVCCVRQPHCCQHLLHALPPARAVPLGPTQCDTPVEGQGLLASHGGNKGVLLQGGAHSHTHEHFIMSAHTACLHT